MKQPLVLFIEDEAALAEIVSESLGERGFVVTHVKTSAAAWQQYQAQKPDIIVADVMLPDGTGFDLVKKIRTRDMETPVIFLTSRSRPEDVVAGFETGGNDYLKKPFSMAELIVRMNALLNRNRQITSSASLETKEYLIGAFHFYYPSGILESPGKKRTLTSREADLLSLLVLNRNQPISRDELLTRLWGNTDYFSGRSLDVFISKLRRYLKEDPGILIVNMRGSGYKLVY